MRSRKRSNTILVAAKRCRSPPLYVPCIVLTVSDQVEYTEETETVEQNYYGGETEVVTETEVVEVGFPVPPVPGDRSTRVLINACS